MKTIKHVNGLPGKLRRVLRAVDKPIFPIRTAASLVLVALFLPWTSKADAVVADCTDAALRTAMAGGGTVTFACDGTITLTNTITVASDTVLDGIGRGVTISGGNTVRVFYVESNVSFTVTHLTIANAYAPYGAGIFNDAGTLTLDGTQFLTNKAYGSYDPGPEGGAVYSQAGTVNATNCLFSQNATGPPLSYQGPMSSRGGAIRNATGLVNLQNCIFDKNTVVGGPGSNMFPPCEGMGGAVHNSGTLNVRNCTFLQNQIAGGAGQDAGTLGGQIFYGPAGGAKASGGAIFNAGNLEIDGSVFNGNWSIGGSGGNGTLLNPDTGGSGGLAAGGAVCNAGDLIVELSLFASNSVSGGQGGGGGSGTSGVGEPPYATEGGPGGTGGHGYGGAIYSSSTASVVNCTIVWNTAAGGDGGHGGPGGVWTYPDTAGRGGDGGNGGDAAGGIYSVSAMTNCTVAFNSSLAGSGGTGAGPGTLPGTNGLASGSVHGGILINTLLATNAPTNCSGSITDAGHNLSSDNSCIFTNVGSVNNVDPRLGPLQDNGGPTLTIALLPGSPAIDAGITLAGIATDQRGVVRPSGTAPDIGAYEWTAPLRLSMPEFTEGSCCLRAWGATGGVVRLQRSVDLSNWVDVATNTTDGLGSAILEDPQPSGPLRFYRVVSP